MFILRATRTAHSARRVLWTPVLMSFRSSNWLKAQMTDLRRSSCCSSSSLTRSRRSVSSNPGFAIAAIVVGAVRLLSAKPAWGSIGHLSAKRSPCRLSFLLEHSTRQDGLVCIQASPSHIEVSDRVGHRESPLNARGPSAAAVGAQHEGGRSGRKRCAEGCSPTGRVGTPGIGSHHAFTGSSHPNRRRAVVREGGLDIPVRGGGDVDYARQRAWIHDGALPIVSR